MALLNEGDTETAPRYAIPARRLGSLEHPMLVEDVDKAIQTFGMNPSLQVVRRSLFPSSMIGSNHVSRSSTQRVPKYQFRYICDLTTQRRGRLPRTTLSPTMSSSKSQFPNGLAGNEGGAPTLPSRAKSTLSLMPPVALKMKFARRPRSMTQKSSDESYATMSESTLWNPSVSFATPTDIEVCFSVYAAPRAARES